MFLMMKTGEIILMKKSRFINLLLIAMICLFTLGLSDTADARGRTRRRWRPKPRIFPFAEYLDAFSLTLRDESPFDLFVYPDSNSDTNHLENSNLWGISLRGRTFLLALTEQGWWRTQWSYRHVDDEVWQEAPRPYLYLSEMPKDVYEVRVDDASGSSLINNNPLWVAWPVNSIPADQSPPAGAIHAEITGSERNLQLHAWGYAYDAIQAGLGYSNSGVKTACLSVDGQRVPLKMDSNGTFDVTVPVNHQRRGIHSVSLYASDRAHPQLRKIDTEYASEYGWPLKDAPTAEMAFYQWHNAFDDVGLHEEYPNAVAVAVPRLNDEGLLVLDGTASENTSLYRWTIGEQGTPDSYHLTGKIVNTEDIPAGVHKVTLNCLGDISSSVNPLGVTTFLLVIPPRVSLDYREVNGALHIRWIPEIVNRRWQWVMHMGGHVYDEIGRTVLGYDADNIEAWVTVNGTRVDLELDSKGHFTGRYVAGRRVSPEYDLILHSRTLDDSDEYEADFRHETKLSLFPWH